MRKWMNLVENFELIDAETLTEAKMVTNPRTSPFAIWQNPGKMDLFRLASTKDLRGFVYEDNVYVWYAGLGIHSHAAYELGIDMGRRGDVMNYDPFYVIAAQYDRASADGQSEWLRMGKMAADVDGCRVYVDKWRNSFYSNRSFLRMVGGEKNLID